MIKKKLIHFNEYATFASRKLSASVDNTTYTMIGSEEVQTGEPDVMYQSVVFIKDTKQIWTHGEMYDFAQKQDVIDNELVTATALNDLNDRVDELSTSVEESGEVTATALTDLEAKIASMQSQIDGMEEIIASSFNGINNRLEALEQ